MVSSRASQQGNFFRPSNVLWYLTEKVFPVHGFICSSPWSAHQSRLPMPLKKNLSRRKHIHHLHQPSVENWLRYHRVCDGGRKAQLQSTTTPSQVSRGADSVRHHLPHAGTHSHLQTLNTKMRTTPQPSTWLSLRFSDHFQTRRTSKDTQPHVDEAYPKPQERVSVPVHGRVHRCAECQKRTQRCHSVSAPVPVESDGSLHG